MVMSMWVTSSDAARGVRRTVLSAARRLLAGGGCSRRTAAAAVAAGATATEDFAVHVLDGELGHSAHFAADPAGEDLAALFLAEAAAREVAAVDKGDDVDDDLVLVEDGVDDDGDDGGEVGLAGDFDEDDNEAAGLEDSAERMLEQS